MEHLTFGATSENVKQDEGGLEPACVRRAARMVPEGVLNQEGLLAIVDARMETRNSSVQGELFFLEVLYSRQVTAGLEMVPIRLL